MSVTGQRFVSDLDQGGGILCHIARGGNHTSHGVSLKPYTLDGQGVHFHGMQPGNVGRHAMAGCPLRQIMAGVDPHHAFYGQGCLRIDVLDEGVGMW